MRPHFVQLGLVALPRGVGFGLALQRLGLAAERRERREAAVYLLELFAGRSRLLRFLLQPAGVLRERHRLLLGEFEFGLDAGLFDDRLAFEVTRYDKLSTDALVRRTLAPSLGLSTDAWANIGSVSNKGWEGLLRGVVLDRDNARFDVTLGASWTRNRLESLQGDSIPITLATGRNRQEHRPGYALGGYWHRPIEYADVNGDGLLQYDRTAGVCNTQRTPTAQCEVVMADTALTYIGQPFPTREASLNSSLTLFKLVRVSALLDHKGGFKVRNHMRFDRC